MLIVPQYRTLSIQDLIPGLPSPPKGAKTKTKTGLRPEALVYRQPAVTSPGGARRLREPTGNNPSSWAVLDDHQDGPEVLNHQKITPELRRSWPTARTTRQVPQT